MHVPDPMPPSPRLPLFPLGLVLYPEERLPLHIFEPKYKEMIGRCVEEDAPFGIVLFDEGHMARVGCTAHVTEVARRYEDGRLDIFVRGERRFRVEALHEDEPYLTAEVDYLDDGNAPLDSNMKERAITQHIRLLELAGRTVRPSLYENVENVSYVLAHNAGLSPQQKQRLLEMEHENERIAFLTRHFEGLIPRVEQIEDVRRKVQSNGHFRDFPSVS